MARRKGRSKKNQFTCPVCKKLFYLSPYTRKRTKSTPTCSRKCRQILTKRNNPHYGTETPNIKCVVCKKAFYRSPSQRNVNKGLGPTCSDKCRSALNVSNTPNTKCAVCNKAIYVEPHKLSDHNTCSLSCRNKWFSGERHPRWVGGPSNHASRHNGYEKKRRHANKQRAVEIMGGKCQNCGYSKCIAALDFHHIDPTTKNGTLKDMWVASWETIEKEITKCILLCANCHRERHWLENREKEKKRI